MTLGFPNLVLHHRPKKVETEEVAVGSVGILAHVKDVMHWWNYVASQCKLAVDPCRVEKGKCQ